ncbi:MAG: hypothetical protein GC179_00225 [Anaerolineaceae bacterium]|nr:hypothetical protein [Anaerolineaceae bacterium]
MRNFYRLFSIVIVATLALAVFVPGSTRITRAQDKPLVCDSTLVTLLMVAEHNYDYLTNMEKAGNTPNIEFGDYKPLLTQIMANMMAMQQNMTQEQMDAAAMEEKSMSEMMGMSNKDIIDQYLKGMMMDNGSMAEATPDAMGSMDAMMTELPTGALANEDPACTALRTDVEHFLLVHTIADMKMGETMK